VTSAGAKIIPLRRDRDELLTKQEVASRLRVSVRWIETRYHDDDPIPSVLLPGRRVRPMRRFWWSRVKEWVDRRSGI
jgi:hypothetical protein